MFILYVVYCIIIINNIKIIINIFIMMNNSCVFGIISIVSILYYDLIQTNNKLQEYNLYVDKKCTDLQRSVIDLKQINKTLIEKIHNNDITDIDKYNVSLRCHYCDKIKCSKCKICNNCEKKSYSGASGGGPTISDGGPRITFW